MRLRTVFFIRIW